MATVRPFPALRPAPELAAQICELPYDVMSSEEARQIAGSNPLSFLHVSKPEIDLPGINPYSQEVYTRGRENFRRLISQNALRADPGPSFYLYRQVMGRHSQTGLVAAASCQEYVGNIIRKHELTRPDKEDDRVRHIEALDAQTGPVFLVYRSTETGIPEFVARTTAEPPGVNFTAADGVRHSSWAIGKPSDIEWVQSEMSRVPRLYIADGHHRCAAAARVAAARKSPASDFILSVIFPHDQVQIMPYHRVLRDLNGLAAAQLLEKLDGVFIIDPNGGATPSRRHQLGLYLAGKWHTLHFRPRFAATGDAVERLDVTLLQKFVLDPILGIGDPRTSQRIQFVGGIRGPSELERMVNSGGCACAFALFPTSIEDLMTVADAGGIMPPKSTWFEPKLRDGMFSLTL